MAKTPITVCIVTLTTAEKAGLDPPEFVARLTAANGYYDFTVNGKPYSVSMDDWRPFPGGDTIPTLLMNENLEPTFMSVYLFDPDKNLEAQKRADLYVIDPVVLMHREKSGVVSGQMQGTIVSGGKDFCIVLPDDLPAGLRAELQAKCDTALNNLKKVWHDDTRGEWEISKPAQLARFFRAVFNRQTKKPNTANLAQLVQLAAAVVLQAPPRMQ